MIKLKSKVRKDGHVGVDVKGKGTLTEYLAIMFTCIDEVPERFDMNRGKLMEIINHHYDYYNKERRK